MHKNHNHFLKDNDLNVLDNIIDNIPQYIFWKDKDLIFRGCNKSFAAQFGYSDPESILGKTDNDFDWSDELRDKYIQDDQNILDSGVPKLNYEEEQNQPDGLIKTVLVSKVPIYKDKEITGVLGIYTDISDRKRMEKELKIAKEKAEQANNAKTEFIKNMSHDIRTPLNGIIGMAQLLELREEDPEKRKFIEGLLSSTKCLSNLLTDILELIRLDSGEYPLSYSPINLRLIAEDVMALMMPDVKIKNLNLSLEFSPKIPELLIGDESRVHRILLNLLSNALKFTETGFAKIKIDLASKNHKQAIINLSVKDSGIGIHKDKFDYIFSRFSKLNFSHKGDYKGSGLGLYIVKKMTESLSGKIEVKSKVNKGTEFICTLPFKIISTEMANQPFLPSPQNGNNQSINQKILKSKKILLVEDSKICQIAAKNLLKELGAEVHLASNGKEALTKLNKPFDIILLDLGLPDMDGITLAEKIRNELKIKTPIISTTAHAWYNKKVNNSLIDDHINKPITLDNLTTILANFI